MAFGVKTNEGAINGTHAPGERPGTRAVVKHVRMSAYKARQVLDAIRGKDVAEADALLAFTEREAAGVIRKALRSAMANAENNEGIDPETLYVSACFADEGTTMKRWRPRARGRATRIRKRTCHITVIVSARSPQELEARRRREEARVVSGGKARTRTPAQSRAARVAKSREAAAPEAPAEAPVEEVLEGAPADEATEVEATEVEATEVEEAPAAEATDEASEAAADDESENS